MDKVLFNRLQQDFPEVKFQFGKKFLFRPPKTIMLRPEESDSALLLLHELGHFLCGHRNFKMEVERLKMEREAWEKARELCKVYGVSYDEEVVEQELDTYRDWLDKKSRCPICGLTRYQTPDGKFHCPECNGRRWG
ncbi:hypothetical protein IJJ37_02405 [Candidatus Saccharibacteria bacterium]|nr:hypothetical protein [Candidatus Saccharibacteria bacterium]